MYRYKYLNVQLDTEETYPAEIDIFLIIDHKGTLRSTFFHLPTRHRLEHIFQLHFL